MQWKVLGGPAEPFSALEGGPRPAPSGQQVLLLGFIITPRRSKGLHPPWSKSGKGFVAEGHEKNTGEVDFPCPASLQAVNAGGKS